MTRITHIKIAGFLAVVMWIASVGNIQAAIVNGSFETGNLTGWNPAGSVSVETASFGCNPTDGTYQALMTTTGGQLAATIEAFLGLTSGTLANLSSGIPTQGSAIGQTFTANAGDVLSFDWNFLTDESPGAYWNDFAFWSLVRVTPSSQNEDLLANTSFQTLLISPTSFRNETGFNTIPPFTITSTGTYILGFGVMDVNDALGNSGLLIDNIQLTSANVVAPEPATFTMLALGAAGTLIMARRRQKRQTKQVRKNNVT